MEKLLLSEIVIEALKANGWYEGRKYNADQWINNLMAEGFVFNEYARIILMELGEIHLKYVSKDKYGISVLFNPLVFASGEYDRYNECYHIVNEHIFPIGGMYDYTIYASNSKKIYVSDWEGIALVGNSVEQFLNNIFNPFYDINIVCFDS